MNPALICNILCFTAIVEILVTTGIGWYFLVTSPIGKNGLVAVQRRTWIVSYGGIAVGLFLVLIVATGDWVLYAQQLALPAVEVPSMPLPTNAATPTPIASEPTEEAPVVLVPPPRSKVPSSVGKPQSASRKKDHGF